jgi:hypothetical protein
MHEDKKDVLSTVAGGGAALTLLASVRWEQIPCGEAVKIVVAFALLIVCYRMYGNRKAKP